MQRPLAATSAQTPETITIQMQQAAALLKQGEMEAAEHLYQQVLRRQPKAFEAMHMLGVIALHSGDPQRAVRLIAQALRFEPNNAPALANLGSALLRAHRIEDALRHYDRALQLDPGVAALLHNHGRALQLLGRHEEAAASFRRLLELLPGSELGLGNLFESQRYCCDWRDFQRCVSDLLAVVAEGSAADSPFSFLSVSDSAALQLKCAQAYSARVCPNPGPPLWTGERYGHDRIRVAYISSDFRNHIVAQMMAGLYEHHDAQRFHTIGVCLNAADSSEVVRRAKRSLGEFIDVSRLTDGEVAALLRAREIDIAVDVNGFTQGCRPGILARRPAPVQVNFLGFPGTMGATWIDYIIADAFVIPPPSEPHYAERVVRLPETFQVNDARPSSLALDGTLSRDAVGLPESALVLCCFNASYKLNPTLLDIWATVMLSAADSVLWLVADQASVSRNLRSEIAARGVDPRRLIFAHRAPYAKHLARLRLADLFLDTLPFNAGASASDAVRAGVPILTCVGEAFAARMAGSLLRAADVPELITFSLAEYRERALELVRDRERLHALKARLTAERRTQPLFNIRRYCRHLESAFIRMWQHAEDGRPPVSFSVAPRSD